MIRMYSENTNVVGSRDEESDEACKSKQNYDHTECKDQTTAHCEVNLNATPYTKHTVADTNAQ